ncbi:TPA: response regulator transcription factor [Enterobacter hormaechei]|nr:response regulator transcription factor [Enterobacter hormaechei]HDT2963718.1 response regulator transcription factor [Enterobacter hormaechei subsp. steigerwaltii]
MTRTTINITIVEDEPFSRQAIQSILSRFPYHPTEPERLLLCSELTLNITGSVSKSSELLSLIRSDTNIDVLLLDYSLVVMNTNEDEGEGEDLIQEYDGVTLIKRILHIRPELKIIVHTAHKSLIIARNAWKCGAWGFVQKCGDMQELFFAIDRVSKGKKFFPIEVAELPEKSTQYSLSSRETEVLRLLLNGLNQNAIAAHLNISFKTVSNAKIRAFRKLGLKSNAEFFRYANEIII